MPLQAAGDLHSAPPARSRTAAEACRVDCASLICCQFIYQPGTYDDAFHRLNGQTDEYARSLPGFERVEMWVAREVVSCTHLLLG